MGRLTEEVLRNVLTGVDPGLLQFKRRLRFVPSPPRCKLCAAPFAGPGGFILRRAGFGRFAGNPALCENCITGFAAKGISGAEIPLSVLFADIRGSTAIAEGLRPGEFSAYLERFYRLASNAVLAHDGIVDKLVGDEVIGLFIGGVTGADRYAAAAVAAGRDLLARVGRPDATATGPIPVGAAVHTGEAYVGTVGPVEAATDFTALGDAVNTTSRIVAQAAAGELLVSLDTVRAGTIDAAGLEQRTLDVRGRTEPVMVVVLPPSA
jgi:adenylate cyclase